MIHVLEKIKTIETIKTFASIFTLTGNLSGDWMFWSLNILLLWAEILPKVPSFINKVVWESVTWQAMHVMIYLSTSEGYGSCSPKYLAIITASSLSGGIVEFVNHKIVC